MKRQTLVGALLALLTSVAAKCYDPSPAFPVPQWQHVPTDLQDTFHRIHKELKAVVEDSKYDTSSFSLEITSSSKTLFSQSHTARVLNETRPGDSHVDSDSLFRIASITKTFTVLGLLHLQKAGNLSLDDTILEHIPELRGELPWIDITLRVLASQLSGLPRDWAQSDVLSETDDPTRLGLPPPGPQTLPTCGLYNDYLPCTRKDFLDDLKSEKPLFAPNQKSTYSNIAFELLGIVIENVTGMNYADYIEQRIFGEIEMTSSTLQTPDSDEHAVLPAIDNLWDVDMGDQNPTGGIYSSCSDMSKYMRYILTHFNTLATGVNWLMPASWSFGLNSFYGMPFEIYRTNSILRDSHRPVTFATKSGGVSGYYSIMVLLEEYGLAFTILVGGEPGLLGDIREIISAHLVQAAEDTIWHDIETSYTGAYIATNTSLNSSLTLSSSPSKGLTLDSFISNGTDVFTTLLPHLAGAEGSWRAQLVPTLLYKNETAQQGEIWRITVVPTRPDPGEKTKIWDDFCIADLDVGVYAGLPLTEVIFWHDKGSIELPAWQVVLRSDDIARLTTKASNEQFVVQA